MDRRAENQAESQYFPQGGYPAEAFARLERLENGHFWFESRNQLIVWAMQRYFANATDFLEIGCGTGFVLAGIHRAIPALKLTAVDFLPDGLPFARSRVPSATIRQLDARNLQAVDAFDVIGTFDVLEHIKEDALVLSRMHTALRPGGGVLVAVPQHPWLWSRADSESGHVRRYRRSELIGRLQDAGFQILHTTSFVSLLLPLIVLSRLLDRRRNDQVGAPGMVVSGPVNTGLRAVLTLERQFIRIGLTLPAGGSLLVVGRKPLTS